MHDAQNEQFAGNRSINAEIHELLASFPEPSRSRMRKKIRQDRDALRKHGTDQADKNARHTFREFLVARQLNHNGFQLEYKKKIGVQDPDWYDEQHKLLLEVFTCERGGSSDPAQRVAHEIARKVTKYKRAVDENGLFLVVAVHGDFLSNLDCEDCEEAIRADDLFNLYHELSGVVFFAESQVFKVRQADGSTILKAQYRFTYFQNPIADRKLELTSALAPRR